MTNLLSVFGEVLKSAFAASATQAIESAVESPAVKQQVQAAVGAAASNIHIPSAIVQVAKQLMPHAVVSWSQAELDQAANAFVAANPNSSMLTLHDAFEAGALWTKTKVSESLQTMVDSGVTEIISTFAPKAAPVAGEVIGDLASVAEKVIAGDTSGAVEELVADVVQHLPDAPMG